MRPSDIDAVVEIARLSFPDHFEARACFENRLALYPRGCFVLTDGDAPAQGYLIAYPWRADGAPPLNTVIEGLPTDPAVLYLHDLALHPETRGGGLTHAVVERLAEQATEGPPSPWWPSMTPSPSGPATASLSRRRRAWPPNWPATAPTPAIWCVVSKTGSAGDARRP